MNKNIFVHFKNDLPARIIMFPAAVPLCPGITLVSGALFFSGMLAAIVLASIAKPGAFEIFLPVVVLAGLFQLVLDLLKAGAIADYFPSSMIKGMLTAIGEIIILKQIRMLSDMIKMQKAIDKMKPALYIWNCCSQLQHSGKLVI